MYLGSNGINYAKIRNILKSVFGERKGPDDSGKIIIHREKSPEKISEQKQTNSPTKKQVVFAGLNGTPKQAGEKIGQMYQKFLKDPASIDKNWGLFFAGFEVARAAFSDKETKPEIKPGISEQKDPLNPYRAEIDDLNANAEFRKLTEKFQGVKLRFGQKGR